MSSAAQKRIAVSSWSLHRLLGTTHPHDLETTDIGPAEETFGPPSLALIDLPPHLAANGIHRLEICSFHLPHRDKTYLGELADALRGAGIVLQTLLIESGDLGDPETAARDTDWISAWVETANEMGAENARIVAGRQQPTREALDRSAAGMDVIARRNAGSPVALVTENWLDLLSTPEAVLYLLDRTEGRIGLNGDLGNWPAPDKYEALEKIMGRASLCHAKAGFADGRMDEDDYGRCIDIAEAEGYAGPYTLIFDSDTPDEWTGIGIERDFIIGRLAA